MQLRKVSNHPLLLRVYYDDQMIRQIAQILTAFDSHYQRDRPEDVAIELSSSSDWEIHEICYARRNSLRQLEPFLLTDEQVFNISGKMNKLKEILERLKAENHRILIFSQMTKMMNILGCFFHRLGHSFIRLDGSTPVNDRQVLIDKFNDSPDIFIFLLSTRAGGLGINLSSADTVIFYDIAFNPQVDRQAEDRCHRLGQTKQVNVITLLTANSCEEQIWEMAHEKKELNDIMLEEGEYSKKYQDEGATFEIIEEKEEEIASDVAMQMVLTHLFSDGQAKEAEPSQILTGKKVGVGEKKRKREPAPRKPREKKEPKAKPNAATAAASDVAGATEGNTTPAPKRRGRKPGSGNKTKKQKTQNTNNNTVVPALADNAAMEIINNSNNANAGHPIIVLKNTKQQQQNPENNNNVQSNDNPSLG